MSSTHRSTPEKKSLTLHDPVCPHRQRVDVFQLIELLVYTTSIVSDCLRMSQKWFETHNLKVVGSNPTPETTEAPGNIAVFGGFLISRQHESQHTR